MAHQQADSEAVEALRPFVEAALDRLPSARFSTRRLIQEVRVTPEGEAAYQHALELASEEGRSSQMAHLVVHGQVVPELLRASTRTRFAGFIHGDPSEDDGYAVPSWWRKV